jgi:hypothetical protein
VKINRRRLGRSPHQSLVGSKQRQLCSYVPSRPSSPLSPRLSVAPSPVTVRSMSNPKPGWKLSDAVDLVQQGYSVAHAARVTGWAASVIKRNSKSATERDSRRALTTEGESSQAEERQRALTRGSVRRPRTDYEKSCNRETTMKGQTNHRTSNTARAMSNRFTHLGM